MPELFVNREGAQTAQVGDFFCLSATPLNEISILQSDPPAEMPDVPATLWLSVKHWHQFWSYRGSIQSFIKELVTSQHLKSYLVQKSEDRRFYDSFGSRSRLVDFYTFHPDTNIVVVFVDSIKTLSNLSTKVFPFVNHSFSYSHDKLSAHIFAHTTAGDGDAQKLSTLIVAIYDFG